MRYLISYDVSDEKRRYRVVEALKDYAHCTTNPSALARIYHSLLVRTYHESHLRRG